MNHETETLAKISHMLRLEEHRLLQLRSEADNVHHLLHAAREADYSKATEVFRLLAQAQASMAQAQAELLELMTHIAGSHVGPNGEYPPPSDAERL